MAFRNSLLIPQFFKISKSLIYCLFLSLLIFTVIWFVPDLIFLKIGLLLSREGS